MKITRLKLNTHLVKTLKALNNPNIFHAALEASLEGNQRSRILWRIDTLKKSKYILVVSQVSLNTKILEDQFGYLNEPAQVKNYNLLLDRVHTGSIWLFKLTANPTKSTSIDKSKRGKVISLYREEDLIKWLKRRGEKNGFLIRDDNVKIISSRWVSFSKKHDKKKRVCFQEVTYQGVLEVTDPEALRQCLREGLGRSKAYGMGLLTLVKVHE
ncbi:MAG: type I-E CRISPR-associated protein Cas6/Cse3/CasE [Allobaculum sp.]|nr:type I-E CRISPR-associated protein Cas6/Cse3/CasE [Allobaculum sp.]